MTDEQQQRVRRAEAVLHQLTREALARTAILLRLIADGQIEMQAAAVASDELVRLLAAMTEASEACANLRGLLDFMPQSSASVH